MPLGLDAERLFDERDEIGARPEWVAKVGLDGPEQAGAKLAIGRQPHPVTTVAVVMAHGGDHPHRTRCAGESEVRGGTVSGGTLHRLGLYDALLIKDNHRAHLRPDELTAAITEACRRGRERYDLRFVEVEVDTLSELEQVLRCPPGLIDIVLLDNMTVGELSEAVRVRDGCGGLVQLEASGGITLDNVRAVAETGVERISVGAITQSAPAMDIALEMEQLIRDR